MNQFDSYRMDNRTPAQFAGDIAKGAKAERDIIERYVRYYQNKYGVLLKVQDNGCDNSGKFLPGECVNTKADFVLNGKPVEVKFNKKDLHKFHCKVDQLKSYIDQGASVLWVNGYETKNPVFMVLKTADLKRIQAEKTPINYEGWGGKICFVLYADDFAWKGLQ